ncbi:MULTISPECIES: outer membrane protein [Bradyrhizobium]|uniref:Outer membrane immunogenic protein n=2 Tax=Bradyrhizobium TaxID=374 RepID=A0ABY0PFD6_9BRAD|nr:MULTISPECIES: outer membrane beta-barrel protein [Bradyrhizobium]SDI26455.1 outer membrane immunogenic protein [Bradyrhizobium ottawaense]SED69108.1 outer membrane immunogenic protein [Bradyrhizobium lablabi]SHL65773.1 outer membrane immunogenic protein [Bradyrhizobium lablabi]
MKRILFTTVSLGVLGLMSPALGADLSPYIKAPAAASPIYDWSGFYVGVFGGGGYGNHNLNNTLGPAGFANFTINYSSTGGIAGGEAGYNVQSGNIVLGVEGDGFWSGIKGSDISQFNAGTLPIGSMDATNLRSGATVRARGGIAVDRLLLFFTGGWAYGNFLHTNTDPVLGIDQFSTHRSGLAAGGGIAYALTDNLIGKFEYRYYDFGRYVRAAPLNGQLPYTVDNTYSVVTVGLDYKFGGPVVAKY